MLDGSRNSPRKNKYKRNVLFEKDQWVLPGDKECDYYLKALASQALRAKQELWTQTRWGDRVCSVLSWSDAHASSSVAFVTWIRKREERPAFEFSAWMKDQDTPDLVSLWQLLSNNKQVQHLHCVYKFPLQSLSCFYGTRNNLIVQIKGEPFERGNPLK